ncbi:MAG: hypothetical protein J6B92_05725 [Paraprevotella sp.]|nr:hypothetical protein [Paraprevotella sp.]
MRNKIFSAAVVAAALTAGYSAYNAQKSIGMSDTLLANVEALASGTEAGKNKVTCYSTYQDPIIDVTPITITECGSCLHVKCSSYTDKGTCNK